MRRRCCHWSLLLVAVSLLAPGLLVAQTGLPENWRTLSAEEFLAAVAGAGASSDAEMVEHAWDHFLADATFVAEGDWATVVKMIGTFASTTSANTIDPAARAALLLRVEDRLSADPIIVSKSSLYELDRTFDALEAGGMDERSRSEHFVVWKKSNSWRSLPLNDQHNLYLWLSADAVDRYHFSARWTGYLAAPTSGDYVFQQVRQYLGSDSQVKLTVNGQVVLDSGVGEGASKFFSQPVYLVAGQKVPILVEAIHNVAQTPTNVIDLSESAPMVVFSWATGSADQQLIPPTAFQPPDGFAEAGENGLKGEYFADVVHTDLVLTRLDPSLDFVRSWPPVAPIHHEDENAVLTAMKEQVFDPQFLLERATAGDKEFFEYHLWRIAYRLTAWERHQLVETLVEHPRVLQVMTLKAMGPLSGHLHATG